MSTNDVRYYYFPKIDKDGFVNYAQKIVSNVKNCFPFRFQHLIHLNFKTTRAFVEQFREDLNAVGIADTSTYSSHSFRRGGAQFLQLHLKWNLVDIMQWGGWTWDDRNMMVIKYLLDNEASTPRELLTYRHPITVQDNNFFEDSIDLRYQLGRQLNMNRVKDAQIRQKDEVIRLLKLELQKKDEELKKKDEELKKKDEELNTIINDRRN